MTDEGTGSEVHTSAEKRGQAKTQRWTRLTHPSPDGVTRDEINGQRKTSKGKPTIFLKEKKKGCAEVSNYIHPETFNLGGAADSC